MDFISYFPDVPHVILNKDHVKENILIVGDIHGCLEEFDELLEISGYSSNSYTLILVGDLVNKGPFSAQTIKRARQLDALCVRGNHDQSLLNKIFLEESHETPIPDSYQYSKLLDRFIFLLELIYILIGLHFI